MPNFNHPNVIAVKKQVQLVRFSLKGFSQKVTPTSTTLLDCWVKCFGYEHWQQFIRQVNGNSTEQSEYAIVRQDNFHKVATQLQSLFPVYNINQIKWALSGTLLNSIKVNSNLIKNLLMRKMPMPMSDELAELYQYGLIDIETRSIVNSEDKIITAYIPTELGRYKAAINSEKALERYLTEIELIQFGLPSNLCKLRSIQRNFTIRY